ncbi:hypothetical protein T4C_12856 [Trichinella pseudospiralis]|uniref:Uncharacterized protein n=1 Tax=Trichinella pseudospiralis TaxID=6337 RepID=A0A0V1G9X4_TRIPS|nr:hypothetical protein T4C_12856 [Trichinella pseudospiralis]
MPQHGSSCTDADNAKILLLLPGTTVHNQRFREGI